MKQIFTLLRERKREEMNEGILRSSKSEGGYASEGSARRSVWRETTGESPRGFTVGRMILWGTGAVILAALFWWTRVEIANARDADRLSDMQYIQAGMSDLYRETHSFEAAAKGCSQKGDLVNTCDLEKYLEKIDTIVDPGDLAYRVTQVPNATSYEVSFTLERGHGKYKAGKHIVTEDGIK